GSLLAPLVKRQRSLRQTMVETHWAWGLLLCCVALAGAPWIVGALLGLIELVVSMALVAQYSYRLSIIPDALRGRVTSVYRLLVFAGQPLGLTLAGVLTQAVQPAPTMLLLGGIALALAGAATLSPQLRQAAPVAHPGA